MTILFVFVITLCNHTLCLYTTVFIFFVEPTKTAVVIRTRVVDIAKWNPLRKKLDLTTEPQISQETISTFHRLLEESLTYDATEVKALRNFQSIRLQSQCIFAKNARIWGSADYQSDLSLGRILFMRFNSLYSLIFSCLINV